MLLVSIEEPGAQPSVERITVGHFHWRLLEASIDSRADIEMLDACLRDFGIPVERLVVELRLKGAIGLATRLALDDMLEQWRAHVRYLEVSDAGLIAQPSEEDLDRIGRGGFIRAAVDRLRAREDDPGDVASDAARLALRILYVEHVRTGA